MTRPPEALKGAIVRLIEEMLANAATQTPYRSPRVGFACAHDSRFSALRGIVGPKHMLPGDILPGAETVVSFFVPFREDVVVANARRRAAVAREWAVAYVETNELIKRVTESLVDVLSDRGFRATGEPPTHNFDPVQLTSHWSHKSVGVIAGLGSFGLHHMVITDLGCAGRFGSVVTDAALPHEPSRQRERCLTLAGGSCRVCVDRCPVDALRADGQIDKHRCYERCLEVGSAFEDLGLCDICGKCAVGPCAVKVPTG
ncbi:MAG: epoxyqueuosine reductase [Chloroflexota bacterium]